MRRSSRREGHEGRDGVYVRNWRESIKRFHGNPELSAALLPLAQAILGDVIRRTEQGGIGAGARIVRLADGSVIKVTRNGGVNTIDILTVPPPSGGVRGLISKILVHPATKSAPHGWIVRTPPDGARTTHPSPYPLAFAYRAPNPAPPPPSWLAVKPPATTALLSYEYGAGTPLRATGLNRDQQLATGNQFALSADGVDIWSWWHSPRGDSRLSTFGPTTLPTDSFYSPFYRGDPDPANVGLYYRASDKALYKVPFVIIKNGGAIVMEGTDAMKEAYVWIAGVHVLGPMKVLAVLVDKTLKKLDLFTFQHNPGEDPTIVAHGTIATLPDDGNPYFPVRFKPDGSEAAFLYIAYGRVEDMIDTTHHRVRCAIVRGVDPDTQAESFSGSLIENIQYHPTLWSRSGSADGWTLEGTQEIRALANDFLYPIALDYNVDGTLEMIWLKGGGSEEGHETITHTASGFTQKRTRDAINSSSSWLNLFFPDGSESKISAHETSAQSSSITEEHWVDRPPPEQSYYGGGYSTSNAFDTITGTSALVYNAYDFCIIYSSTRKRLLTGTTVFKIGIGDNSSTNTSSAHSNIGPAGGTSTFTGTYSRDVTFVQEIKLFQGANVTSKVVFSVHETPGYTDSSSDTVVNKPWPPVPEEGPFLKRFLVTDVGLDYDFYRENGSICGIVDIRNDKIPVYLTEVVWPKAVYYMITGPEGATPHEVPAGQAIMTNIAGADFFLRYGAESYNRPFGIV